MGWGRGGIKWKYAYKTCSARHRKIPQQNYPLLREKSIGRKRIAYKRVWVEWIPALGMTLEEFPRSAEFPCDGLALTRGTWVCGLSLGEPVLASCHFHCIKDHFGDTELCQLIDMDTVNSSGMEPENVGHLVNSYRAARMAFNINLPSRPGLPGQWLKPKQAGTALEGATWPANIQYSDRTQ